MGVSVVTGSDAVSYITLLDEVSDTLSYVGKANPNSGTNSAVWQIKRIQTTGQVLAVEFADGDAKFDNIWDNRASLTYS